MKTLGLLVPVLLWSAVAAAQTPEQVMREGNQLYQQGDYAGARKKYEALRAQQYGGVELFYNLGNACYKTGDLPQAVINYERARRLAPNDEDLRHNLQLINLQLTDRIEPAPRLFLWETWDGITAWLSLDGITVSAYLFLTALLGSLAAVLLAHSYRARRLWLIGGGVAGILLVFSLVLFVARLEDIGRDDEAVVTVPITSVKNAPDAESSDAFVLHAGVKVTVIDRVETWIKIRLADGKVGWMRNGVIEVI